MNSKTPCNATPKPCYATQCELKHFLVPAPNAWKLRESSEDLVVNLLPAARRALFPRLGKLILELASYQVGFGRIDELAASDDLVADIEDNEQDQADIGDEEILGAPWHESSKSLGDCDNGAEGEAIDGKAAAAPALEWKSVAINILSLECAHKA